MNNKYQFNLLEICKKYASKVAISIMWWISYTYSDIKDGYLILTWFLSENVIINKYQIFILYDLNPYELIICLAWLRSLNKTVIVLNKEDSIDTIKERAQFFWAVIVANNMIDNVNSYRLDLFNTSLFFTNTSNVIYNWYEKIAIIAYTSGTTWYSKKVAFTYKNILSIIYSTIVNLEIPIWESILLPLSFWHMYGFSILLAYIAQGWMIHIPSYTINDVDIINYILIHRIQWLALQPRHFHFLQNKEKNIIHTNLRYITFASWKLSPLELEILSKDKSYIDYYMYYALTEVPRAIVIKNPRSYIYNWQIPIGESSAFMKVFLKQIKKNWNNTNLWEIILQGDMVALWYIKDDHSIDYFQDYIFYTWDIGFMHENYIYRYARKKDLCVLWKKILNPIIIEESINKLDFIEESLFYINNWIPHVIINCDAKKIFHITLEVLQILHTYFNINTYKPNLIFNKPLKKNNNGKIIRP